MDQSRNASRHVDRALFRDGRVCDERCFSPALGAFITGSILAETVEAEQIEHLVSPVKDLFAAVFFVSVGMLINLTFW